MLMIDFILTHKYLLLVLYTLACFFVWALCAVAGQADEEQEKMGRLRRVK